MSKSTGPILAAGGITLFNQLVVAGQPIENGLRTVVGTGIAAGLLALFEKGWEKPAVGIAWLAFITVMFTRIDKNTPSPFESFNDWMSKK